MTTSDMQVGKLELAARALDLTSALLNATSSSSIILKGAWEIGQWLGREKLNQYELLDCMEKSKGLAFANKNGLGLFEQIIGVVGARPVGPLFLQQSGSLGRLMAGDPNQSWMVSTTACLFQHHRDDRLVTEKLTAFIMESHRARGPGGMSSATDAFIHNPEHTRVRAVVRKIVSSVWYNVVNAGCDTIPLPKELLDLCERGHYLDPGDFGIVTSNIQAHCKSKAILRTDHFLRDVFLWLLLHYDGTLVVNVGGQIVYHASLGNPHRELEVHVASSCPTGGGECSSSGRESYKILRHISGKVDELLSGASFSDYSDLLSRPGIRQKLYDIPRPYPFDSPLWNKGTQMNMKCAAQLLMRWLLHVPLSTQPSGRFTSVGFTAHLLPPSSQEAAGMITMSHVLKRIPAIVSLQWGSLPDLPFVFVDAVVHAQMEQHRSVEDRLIVLIEYFPILSDVARKISGDCLCPNCSESGSSDRRPKLTRLKEGCLRRMVLEEILLLLAHGVADGFGVNDVASVLDTTPIVEGMLVLLLKLVQECRVCWDTWFALASCTYLGCPFERPVSPSHPAFGGTAFAAIQFGNLAAMAPWLDVTQNITIQGCFGLVGLKGRLGVVFNGDSDSQHAQFRGVEENFAIIETEGTEDTTSFCSSHPKGAVLMDHHFSLSEDQSTLNSDVILCQIDDSFYRVLLRVRAKAHWRIVDPSDAFSSVIRMLPHATCQHVDRTPDMSSTSAKLYTMNEILGRWPDNLRTYLSTTAEGHNSEPSFDTFYITNVLDTQLKKNVALALSVCQVAVPHYPELACLACTVDHARRLVREPLRDGEGGAPSDRFVISLKTQLAEANNQTQKRLPSS